MDNCEKSRQHFLENPYCSVCGRRLKIFYKNKIEDYMLCQQEQHSHCFIELDPTSNFVAELRFYNVRLTFYDKFTEIFDSENKIATEEPNIIVIDATFQVPKHTDDINDFISKISKVHLLL